MLTESAIEAFAIKLLERLGYIYLHGPSMAPDSDSPERSTYADVLLFERMTQAARRINHRLPKDVVDAALKDVQRIHSPDLLANNEAFHRLLTEGVAHAGLWQIIVDGFLHRQDCAGAEQSNGASHHRPQ